MGLDKKTDQGKDIRTVSPGRGPKPTIAEETKRKIIRSVRENSQKQSTRSLATKHNMSNSTVFNILKEKNCKYRRYDIPQNLTDDERANRVAFCQRMLEDDGQMIYETFFSDEMGIRLSDAHRLKVWGNKDSKMELEIPRDNV